MNIYAVKDELAGGFLNPRLFRTRGEAERDFREAVNSIDLWKNNASDFSLYELGAYDENTGEIVQDIQKIGSGHSYLR